MKEKTGKVCTGRKLAKALAQVELPPAAALAWRKDLLRARKTLKPSQEKSLW
jgi:hypothetical protein